MSRRLAWSLVAYLKRPTPAWLALIILFAALITLALSIMYVIRYGQPAPSPVPRGASQSACSSPMPNPPQGYSPCDPIPTNTGFQTGDIG